MTRHPIFSLPAIGAILLRYWGDALFAMLAFVLVWLLLFATPPVTESIDYVLFYQANFQFLKDSILEGRIPLWNPYIGLGRPFLADVQNAVFYPPVYLTFLGPGIGVFLLIWLHVLLAMFGMRALGRELGMSRPIACLVALSFSGSLILTGRLLAGQLLYACALCYLPLLFWCANRVTGRWNGRLVAAYALLLALQFLCGHPQVFWFSTLGQCVFVLFKIPGTKPAAMSLTQFGTAFGLTLGLISVALFPFLELVGQGNRAMPSTKFVNFGRLEWLDLFALITDPPLSGQVDWEKNLFIGAIMVVAGLAGLARLKDPVSRALLVTLIFALLVAVGDQTPLFAVFYHWLPGFSSFRVHVRAGALIAFVLLLSAGRWLSRPRSARMDSILLALAGASTLLLLWHFCGKTSGRHLRLPLAFWLTLVSTGVLFISLGVRRRATRLGGFVLASIFLLQGVDLINANLATRSAYAFLNIQKVSPDFPYQSALTNILKDLRPEESIRFPTRVLVSRKMVPANFGMIHRYSSVDAYTSLFLLRPWDYLHGVLGLEAPKLKNTSLAEQVFEIDPFSRPELAVDVGMDNNARKFTLNSRGEPRVFATLEAEAVGSHDEAIRRLKSGHEVRQTTLVEQPLRLGSRQPASATANARLTHWTPNAITVEVKTPDEALLVMAEAWYPGWNARIGEAVVESLPANAWMQAYPVPAGNHTVEIFFHQNYLAVGGVISMLSLAVCMVLLMRRPRSPA